MSSRELPPALTFDDILLVPQHSAVQSRSQVDLSTQITPRRRLRLPVWAANMDSVCEGRMAAAMALQGGIGVIHRYLSIPDQAKEVLYAAHLVDTQDPRAPIDRAPLAAAIGAKDDRSGTLEERAIALVEAGAGILVIDIAHGDHEMTLSAIDRLKNLDLICDRDGMFVEIVAGNVATPGATARLIAAGADAVKAGIGPGSLCTTRIMTGHGVAQFTAILECSSVSPYVIADGGIRYPGDVVKALAAGASSVMLGSMLAGTDEAPGEITTINGAKMKTYRGMASFEAQSEYFVGRAVDTPEGVATLVPYKGAVESILRNIAGGIKSGCSYSGVTDIPTLRTKAQWRRVTLAGLKESHAHGKA